MVANLQRYDQSQSRQLEEFVTVCWGIWKNKNELRMGGKGKAGRTMVRNAMHLGEEF